MSDNTFSIPTSPKPGHMGNLTTDQLSNLKLIWRTLDCFFRGDWQSWTQLPTATCLEPWLATTQGSTPSTNSSKGAKVVKQYSPQEIRKAFYRACCFDHPDSLILRFLRARKFDPVASLNMLLQALIWRLDVNVVGILKRGEALVQEEELKSGKSYLYGFDRLGRPICFVHVAKHFKKQAEIENIMLQRFMVLQMETARCFLRPGVDCADIFFDMQGFSLSNMDYGFVKFMVNCFQSYYPESLGNVFVWSSPWIFSSVWRIIQPWLDPVVVKKVVFLNSKEELFKYIHPRWLIKSLGGKSDFVYKFTPCSDIPTGKDANLEIIPVEENMSEQERTIIEELEGAINGFEHRSKLWSHAEAIKDTYDQERIDLALKVQTYWQELDQFVRAPTLYHRLGLLARSPPPNSSATPGQKCLLNEEVALKW